MLDKNGMEIKTGDVVEISGAYFKNDNGFWFVEHSDGDPGWSGKDHSLCKISKTGKISTAKHNLCFWPIMIVTNSWQKRAEAKSWNRDHAQITIRNDIDRRQVAEHFSKEAEGMMESIERLEWDFGEGSQVVKDAKEKKSFLEKVSRNILSA